MQETGWKFHHPENLSIVKLDTTLIQPQAIFILYRIAFRGVWTATARSSTSRSHTSKIVVGREGLCTKTQSSLLNIYFHLSGFQASLLLIYFATGRILHIKSTRYVKFHFRNRRGAASLRHRNHAALTVHLCEQKRYPIWFAWRRKSYPV